MEFAEFFLSCYILRRKRTEFFKKAEAGCEDWSTAENRELLRLAFVLCFKDIVIHSAKRANARNVTFIIF